MYGRLADPTCTIGTDPRADPRMVKALAPFGLDGHMPVPSRDAGLADGRPARRRRRDGDADGRCARGARAEPAEPQRRRHHDDHDHRRRRQRHRGVHHPPESNRRASFPGSCTSTAAGWRSTASPTPATPERAKTSPPQGLWSSASNSATAGGRLGPHPYPAGPQRLRVRHPLGVCEPRGSRHQPPDHLRRVRRRQPDADHPAQGEAGGLARTRSRAPTRSARSCRGAGTSSPTNCRR